jgi:predicted transcriptional regulator
MRKRLAAKQLESHVLDVLWDAGAGLTPRQVYERVTSERPLAYTTVNTVLVRLWRKGVVRRNRSGRTFLYQAVEARAQHSARRMREILAASGDHSEALASFVDSLDADDRALLRKMFRARRG